MKRAEDFFAQEEAKAQARFAANRAARQAEIDDYAKNKRSFWDVVTGSNKPTVTPPLQQPEILVPSPTDNLPKGAPVPAIPADSKSSSMPEPEGPGAMNVPVATETKQ